MSDDDAHKIARLAVAAHIADNVLAAALRDAKTVPTAELVDAQRAQVALRDVILKLPSAAFEKIN